MRTFINQHWGTCLAVFVVLSILYVAIQDHIALNNQIARYTLTQSAAVREAKEKLAVICPYTSLTEICIGDVSYLATCVDGVAVGLTPYLDSRTYAPRACSNGVTIRVQ